MFRMKIKTDNAAFEDDNASELARILREIADMLESGHTEGTARDINGNTVGEFTCYAKR